jgi:hypothetical protein
MAHEDCLDSDITLGKTTYHVITKIIREAVDMDQLMWDVWDECEVLLLYHGKRLVCNTTNTGTGTSTSTIYFCHEVSWYLSYRI